jgi:hypothetical protein
MAAYTPYNIYSLGIDTRTVTEDEMMAELKLAILWACF